MLTEILAITLFLIAALLVYAATKPDTFRFERSTVIKAPPEKIFPLIDDLHAWSAWSPWEKKDPAMKRIFTGPQNGPGATYRWEGNKNIGVGSMAITETVPPGKVVIRLDFVKPFEAHNIVEFNLLPQDGGTLVTWVMHGPMPYVSKLMTTFFSMDKMCGKDFESGLAQLKAVAES
jgi:uncharacterized protein YndB with AHSA1/START domain